jgi:hypothetical protein
VCVCVCVYVCVCMCVRVCVCSHYLTVCIFLSAQPFSAGWCTMEDLLCIPKVAKLTATKEDLYSVVDSCKKKRFEIKEEDFVEYIRATQG